MLPSSAGAEIGPEENSEAAGPIFKKLAFGVLTNDRTFAKRTEPSRVLFFWVGGRNGKANSAASEGGEPAAAGAFIEEKSWLRREVSGRRSLRLFCGAGDFVDAHVGAQDFGDEDGAVGLLEIFGDGDPGAADGDAGTI